MRNLISIMILLFAMNAVAVEAPSTWTPTGEPFSAISSKMGFSYFGYYSSDVSDLKAGDASVYTYHSLALSYRLNPRFSAGLRLPFTVETSGTRFGEQGQASRTEMADTNIALIDKAPLNLPYAIKSKAVYKYILPTTPEWREAHSYGALGADLELTRDLNSSFGLGYYFKGYLVGKSARKDAQLEQWLRLTKYFGDRFNIAQGIGLKDEFYNGSSSNPDRHARFQMLETSLNFSLTEHWDLSIAVAQENALSRSDWQIYRDDETSYVLMTSFWM